MESKNCGPSYLLQERTLKDAIVIKVSPGRRSTDWIRRCPKYFTLGNFPLIKVTGKETKRAFYRLGLTEAH